MSEEPQQTAQQTPDPMSEVRQELIPIGPREEKFTLNIGKRFRRGSEKSVIENIGVLDLAIDSGSPEKTRKELLRFIEAIGVVRFAQKVVSEIIKPFSYDATEDSSVKNENTGEVDFVSIKWLKAFDGAFDPTSRQSGLTKRKIEQKMNEISIEWMPIMKLFTEGKPINMETKMRLMNLTAEMEKYSALLQRFSQTNVKRAKTKAENAKDA